MLDLSLTLNVIVLILAIPVGLLIARHTRDELSQGRKYFRILIITSILGVIWFWLADFQAIAWTMAFVFVVSFVSFVKS